ncbi:MAG: hypothetical protein LBL49_03930 [Clostridiales Family XIII bacterium]|jgi:hypothetical protein|nr:hypothetical protein [Clostridiales Family XIII bacterium]
MKEISFSFLLPPLYNTAAHNLKRMCGFREGDEEDAAMLADALDVHDRWAEDADIDAIAVFQGRESVNGNMLTACGVSLTCPAFELVDTRKLTSVIFYAITLKQAESNIRGEQGEDNIMAAFYADAWANAYLEAGMYELRMRLLKSAPIMGAALLAGIPAHGAVLSDSFGPGFYGMELTELHKMAQIIDFSKIGAQVTENAVIHPMKSHCGILFAATDIGGLPSAGCRECVGDRRGCRYCTRYAGDAGNQVEKNG